MTNKTLIDVAKIERESPEEHKKGLVHHLCEYLVLEKTVPRDEEDSIRIYNSKHRSMNYVSAYSGILQLSNDPTHRLYAEKILDTYQKLKETKDSRTQRINETPTESYSSGNHPVLYNGRTEEWWRQELEDMGAIEREE